MISVCCLGLAVRRGAARGRGEQEDIGWRERSGTCGCSGGRRRRACALFIPPGARACASPAARRSARGQPRPLRPQGPLEQAGQGRRASRSSGEAHHDTAATIWPPSAAPPRPAAGTAAPGVFSPCESGVGVPAGLRTARLLFAESMLVLECAWPARGSVTMRQHGPPAHHPHLESQALIGVNRHGLPEPGVHAGGRLPGCRSCQAPRERSTAAPLHPRCVPNRPLIPPRP